MDVNLYSLKWCSLITCNWCVAGYCLKVTFKKVMWWCNTHPFHTSPAIVSRCWCVLLRRVLHIGRCWCVLLRRVLHIGICWCVLLRRVLHIGRCWCVLLRRVLHMGICWCVLLRRVLHIGILAGYPVSLGTLPLPPPPSHSSLPSALPPSDHPASARIFGVSSLKITTFPSYI